MPFIETFNATDFSERCNRLAEENAIFKFILTKHGYPPIWQRPLSFDSIVHIILEQQVSLASAMAAFTKLKEKLGEITPLNLLQLTDEELKGCYFSRQKTGYVRHLAENILGGNLNIEALASLDNDVVRQQLLQIKGIGHWTVDVILMFCLQRSNLFPIGDIALVNSVRHQTGNLQLSKTEILAMAEAWSPNRTVAAYLFWHAYLCGKKNVNRET